MKKKIFESYDRNNNLVKTDEFDLKTTWEDLSLKDFIAYMKIKERFEAFNEEFVSGNSDYSDEEKELQAAIFFTDMLCVLTGLPKEFIYTMNISEVYRLYEELDYSKETLTKETANKFFFRSASLNSIKQTEIQYKKASFLKPKEKMRLKAELELMKLSEFTLKGDCNDLKMKNWIATRGILKEIKNIQGQMLAQNFENYALLIAYIVQKNGNVMTIKESKKLAIVLEDMPFVTAHKIVNFFLSLQNVLSDNTLLYLQTIAQMMKTSQKPLQKND